MVTISAGMRGCVRRLDYCGRRLDYCGWRLDYCGCGLICRPFDDSRQMRESAALAPQCIPGTPALHPRSPGAPGGGDRGIDAAAPHSDSHGPGRAGSRGGATGLYDEVRND